VTRSELSGWFAIEWLFRAPLQCARIKKFGFELPALISTWLRLHLQKARRFERRSRKFCGRKFWKFCAGRAIFTRVFARRER
jgi:hypothetical protein